MIAKQLTNQPLSRKILRGIEQKLGIYLDSPIKSLRTPNQQFGVYDELETHAGDICAVDKHFTAPELEQKITSCFFVLGKG